MKGGIKSIIVAVLGAATLASFAIAGSLTPAGVVGSTMHTLAEVYDSLAGTFDSSAVVANRNGNLTEQLKYIASTAVWASGSNNIWNLNSGNVGIGTTNPTATLQVVGTASVSGHTALGNLAGIDHDKLYDYAAPIVLNIGETQTDLSNGPSNIHNDLLLDPQAAGFNYAYGATTTILTKATNAQNINFIYGNSIYIEHDGSGTIPNVYGDSAQVTKFGPGVITNSYGGSFVSGLTGGSGGSITNAYGVFGEAYSSGAGNVAQAVGGLFALYNSNGATITNGIGVKIASATFQFGGGGLTNQYGLFVQDQTSAKAANAWNIYSDGADSRNYFAGNVGVGTANPTTKMQISNGADFGVGADVTAVTPFVFSAVATDSSSEAAAFVQKSAGQFKLKFVPSADNSVNNYHYAVSNYAYVPSGVNSKTTKVVLAGSSNAAEFDGTGDISSIRAVDSTAYNYGGNVNGAYCPLTGICGNAENDLGTVSTWLQGVYGWVGNFDGTVQNQTALFADVNNGNANTINNYGLYVTDQSGVVTQAGNTWNIYSAGTGRNYFGGNVGIGTTTPNFNLDVNGVLAASVSGNADLVLNNSQNQDGLFRLRSVGGATTSRLDIMGSASASLVSIASTGYVGIGTTAPIAQLHVPGLAQPTIMSTTTIPQGVKSVYVQGRYAYVSSIGITGLFQIFDVTNAAAPALMASISLGAQPYAVTVQGQYAYVVDATQNALRILNVSNPTRPTTVSSITIGSNPKAVTVQGRYVYVLGQTSNLLQIIDAANPSAPVIVGSVAIGAASQWGLVVQGRYAYVANVSAKTFQVIDINNPTSPVVVATVATAGTAPTALAVEGRYAYIGETTGQLIEVFDVSNPRNPFSVTTISTGASSNPQSIFIQDHILYVVTNLTNKLLMFDVSNPASPVSFGSATVTTGPWNIFVQGRYAYIGSTQGTKFQIVDVGGAYIQQLEAGGLDTSTLNVRGNSQMFNNMDIGGGLVIGRGLQVTGPVSFTSSISGAYNTFAFDANGNVGIGTTHVDAGLEINANALTTASVASISGTSLAGGSIFNITVPASSSANNPHGLMLVTNTAGTTIASWSMGGTLSLAGKILSDGAVSNCTGANAPGSGCIDYAESFPTTDTTLEAGDIVAVDASAAAHVKKADGTTAPLGIVSTNPAALVTGNGLLSGSSTHEDPSGTVPVALAGRVPVKISAPVHAGDHLALSTVPGSAVTASVPGLTIGIALEDSSGPTVLTFVNTSYWAPDAYQAAAAGESPATIGWQSWAFSHLFSAIIEAFSSILHIGFSDGQVTTKTLCLDDVCVNRDQLKELLDRARVQAAQPTETPTPTATPDVTVIEPTPTPSVTPDVSPIPTPDVTPVPSDSPTPTPTPTTSPTPGPTQTL